MFCSETRKADSENNTGQHTLGLPVSTTISHNIKITYLALYCIDRGHLRVPFGTWHPDTVQGSIGFCGVGPLFCPIPGRVNLIGSWRVWRLISWTLSPAIAERYLSLEGHTILLLIKRGMVMTRSTWMCNIHMNVRNPKFLQRIACVTRWALVFTSLLSGFNIVADRSMSLPPLVPLSLFCMAAVNWLWALGD